MREQEAALSNWPDPVVENGTVLVTAGVDEAGRGSLAGAVVAAAVILDPRQPISGLRDSKQLSPRRREDCFERIQASAQAFGVGRASVAEIDRLNILNASLLAMQRAVAELNPGPACVYVDGNHCPDWPWRCRAIVKGDTLVPAIAAASIVAKVTRDRDLLALDQEFPEYGFARHKGYPTPGHFKALRRFGPCPLHRHGWAAGRF